MTSDPSSSSPDARLRSLKLIVGALGVALLLTAVVVTIVLPADNDGRPWHLGLGLLLVAVTSFVGRTIGRRVAPLDADDPDPATSAFRSIVPVTLVAGMVAESGGLLSLALAFVNQTSRAHAGLPLVAAALGVCWAAWPGPGRLQALATQLDSRGARSGLAELG